MNRKTKTKPAQLRLKLSYTALRFNPARLWSVENVVKGRDKRRKERAALDNIFNAMPPSVFFTLDNAVGVIDRMTGVCGIAIHNQPEPLRKMGFRPERRHKPHGYWRFPVPGRNSVPER